MNRGFLRRYTVRGCRYSQLHSISRAAMRELLSRHPIDAPVWLSAVEFANKQLQQAAPNRRSTTGVSRDSVTKLESSGSPSSTRPSPSPTGASAQDDSHLQQAQYDSAVQAGWLPTERQPAEVGGAVYRISDTAPQLAGRRQSSGVMVRGSATAVAATATNVSILEAHDTHEDHDTPRGQRASDSSSEAPLVVSAAWMQEREKAEALMRTEMAQLRQEMRQSFDEITNALTLLSTKEH